MKKVPLRFIRGGITAPQGFIASGVAVGIKYSGRKDLSLIYSAKPAAVAGVFTTNQMKAAPVLYDQKIVRGGVAQAIISNSGCANAGTGPAGYADTLAVARLAAQQLKLSPSRILVCSTGAIGTRLPLLKMRKGIQAAALRLSRAGSSDAAHAIMTTDLVSKEVAAEFLIAGRPVRIGAIAKGSGMIQPNMATMLAFISTDAAASASFLRTALAQAVNVSFNRITVDNEQSTNDTVLLLANGASGAPAIRPGSREAKVFQEALTAICVQLAKMIARDGEGATKLIEVNVRGARTEKDAARIALRVAGSDLMKAAVHGGDPNVGRILAAVGATPVSIRANNVSVWIGQVPMARNGSALLQNEKNGEKEMRKDPVRFMIDLGMGKASATAWGCDLSAQYVTINAKYRT